MRIAAAIILGLALMPNGAGPARAKSGDQHDLTALPRNGALVIDVFNLKVLRALEKTHRFGTVLGGNGAANLATLVRANSRYRSVAERLTADLQFMRRQILGRVDHAHGFIIRDMVYNSAEAYAVDREGDAPRQLNPKWLVSRFARFRLVALVNRYDKIDTDKNGCGEVRLIYRLAYRVPDARPNRRGRTRFASVLPVMLNVVLEYPKAPDCSAFARRWRLSSSPKTPNAYALWLRKGPLAAPLRFKQLEVNLQSLRFTAGYMKDIGGQAMYILRVFRPTPGKVGRLSPAVLENVPDVVRLKRDSRLRKKMIEFIARQSTLKAIDTGTVVLPNIDGKLLAKIAISFSTLGRARLANKPFTELLMRDCRAETDKQARRNCANLQRQAAAGKWVRGVLAKDVRASSARIDFSARRFVKSYAGLIDRLDNRTCMGCHQSAGTAGFHILGMTDDLLSDPYSQIAVPYSPHYFAERSRRLAYLRAIVEGRKPNRFRTHSMHPPAIWSGRKLPEIRKAKSKETCLASTLHYAVGPACAAGTVCSLTIANHRLGVQFGECVLIRKRTTVGKPDNRSLFAGHACRKGRMIGANRFDTRTRDWQAYATAGLPYNILNFRSSFKQGAKLYADLPVKRQSRVYSCRPPGIGVPLGRTFRRCRAAEKTFDVYDAVMPKGRRQIGLAALRQGKRPQEICALVGGSAFERCAATNDVLTCLKTKGVARGMLDACWPGRFCREDYICQRFPLSVASATNKKAVRALRRRHIGFCTPTYFVFSMRSDGHPDPTTGIARSDRPSSRRHRGSYNAKFGVFRWRQLAR